MSVDSWVYLVAAVVAGLIVWRLARQYEAFLDEAWERNEAYREGIAAAEASQQQATGARGLKTSSEERKRL